MPNIMDYSLIHHSPDGTGMFLVTLPGTPDRGSYMTEQEFKEWIVSSIGGGIVPKGDILSSNLPPADASNKGWQYYCTDINKYAVSDGTAWIYFSNSPIVQTPDATDTGHALSNAVVTQCCNEVKANVQNNSQRITNIENALSGTVIQEHIDSTQKNVKTILSADELLPWAILKRVGARTERLNQLVKNGNLAQGTSNIMPYNPNYIQVSVSDGVLTHTILPNGATYPYEVGVNLICLEPKNRYHKFLYVYKAKPSLAVPIRCELGGGATTISDTLVANEWNFVAKIATAFDQYGTAMLLYPYTTPTSMTVQYKDVVLRDLTDLFGSGYEPTVETIMSDYPWLLQYSDVSIGSLLDLPPTSFLCRGTNQWDEQWKHWVWNTDGTHYNAPSFITSENKIRVIPNQKYYFLYPNTGHNMVIYVWDRDGNILVSGGIGTDWTMPATAYEMVIMLDGYSTDYNNDIMVCLYSVTDKTHKPANHRTIDTSFMAGKKYVNPSCHDYAENVYVNGILKRKMQTRVGMIELDGSPDESYSAWSYERYIFSVAGFISPATNVVSNIRCNRLTTVAKDFVEQGNYQISGVDSNGHGMMIHITSAITDVSALRTWLSQNPLKIYFELATLPDPTYGDPIPNFPCEDGSTIMANTPQTEIVNAIDVPSTIGYSTKIS